MWFWGEAFFGGDFGPREGGRFALFRECHPRDVEPLPKMGYPKLDVATQPSATGEADGSEQAGDQEGYG